MTDITKHVALRKLYEASLSLERLPASPEQTATAILISDASQSVDALVSEVNRIQNVAIMSDFTFMAAQELREAVEPFRCDTFGCETSQSERLDKACAALDRVRGNGLLKAAKDAEITRLTALVNRLTEDNATEYLLGRRDEVAMKDTIEAWMPGRIKEHEETITRLKADVTNRDAAIERMRRESPARVMGAHMDRVEGALGFPPDKPIIIDMVIARIEQLNAALARVRGQRDAAALLVRNMWRGSDLCANSEVRANVDLEPIGIRVIGGTVEEIEK